MGKTVGLLFIAAASGMLVFYFVVPLFAHATSGSSSAASPAPAADAPALSAIPNLPAGASRQSAPSTPVDAAMPPQTAQQQAVNDLETRRAPYYRWVRDQAADLVADVRPADDDAATLLIYTTVDRPDVAPALTREIIAPAAFRFGFRHVRYFAPNPPGDATPYRLDAEAAEADGNWNTFPK